MAELRVTTGAPSLTRSTSTAAFLSAGAASAPARALQGVGGQVVQAGAQALETGRFFQELKQRQIKSDDWKQEKILETRMEQTEQALIQSNTDGNTDDWIKNFDSAFKDFGGKELTKMSLPGQEKLKADLGFNIEKLKTKWITKQNVQQQREKVAILNTNIDSKVNSFDKDGITNTLQGAFEAGVISETAMLERLPKDLRNSDIQQIESMIVDDPWNAKEVLENPKANGLENLTAMDIRIRDREAQEQINRYNAEHWKTVDTARTLKEATPTQIEEADELIQELLGEDKMSDGLRAHLIEDMSTKKQVKTDWGAFRPLTKQAEELNPNDEDHTEKLEIFHRNLGLANFGTDARREILKVKEDTLEGFDTPALKSVNERRKLGRDRLEFAKLDGQFGDLYDYETERVVGTEKEWFTTSEDSEGKFRFLGVTVFPEKEVDVKEQVLIDPDRTAGFGKGFDPRSDTFQNASRVERQLSEQFDNWLQKNPDATTAQIESQIGSLVHRTAINAGVNSINLANRQPAGDISINEARAILGKF